MRPHGYNKVSMIATSPGKDRADALADSIKVPSGYGRRPHRKSAVGQTYTSRLEMTTSVIFEEQWKLVFHFSPALGPFLCNTDAHYLRMMTLIASYAELYAYRIARGEMGTGEGSLLNNLIKAFISWETITGPFFQRPLGHISLHIPETIALHGPIIGYWMSPLEMFNRRDRN